MSNRHVILLTLLLAGCRAADSPSPLPQQIGDGWRLTPDTVASATPPLLEGLGVQAVRAGKYSGPAEIAVRVFTMKTETAAFEAMQKWKRSDGLAVYKGRNFVVVQEGNAQDKQLADFIEGFRKVL